MPEPTSPTPPAPTESELLLLRREKLGALRAKGIEPFGGRFDTTHAPGTLRAEFVADLEVRVAGRVTARRVMGKAAFFDLSDIQNIGNALGNVECPAGDRSPNPVGQCRKWSYTMPQNPTDMFNYIGVGYVRMFDAGFTQIGRAHV